MGNGINTVLGLAESGNELAFVFPGQGSQSVGMLNNISKESAVIQRVFGMASDALEYDLWALVQNGPNEKLNQTEYTQPALLTAGVALWQWWLEQHGTRPSVLAGHSLGEYTALVCAGVLSLADGVRLVAERGRLMQSAVPEGEGAMAAILGLQDELIENACAEINRELQNRVVSPANYNSPGQVVIAGHRDAVLRVMDKVKELGAKRSILLPVSVPSHCALMKPAAEALMKVLAEISLTVPEIPVIQNVSVKSYEAVEAIREALIKQLYCPVQWVQTIYAMRDRNIKIVLECGPGTVLSGLNKRIVSSLQCESVEKGVLTCS